MGRYKKKKNLFLFDLFFKTIHIKITANMVVMRIINNTTNVRRLL